jgi:hypothetical protein
MASELPAHRATLTNSSTEKAKAYIQGREIPQLFEALMTGLMFKQPDDHLDYIIGCLQKLKSSNASNKTAAHPVKWNTFLTSAEAGLSPLKENTNQKEARIVSGNN